MAEIEREVCMHVAASSAPATVMVSMRSIAGPATRTELNTETAVCAVCAGLIVRVMMTVEKGA